MSRRPAATATPCSAITSSSAASHAGSAGPSRNRRERSRNACSYAATRPACAGSSPSTSRSRNRRRPPGPSRNSRSIAGVNHTIPSCSPSAAWLRTGSPSMRTTLRSLAVRSRPVPTCSAPRRVAMVAATAQPESPEPHRGSDCRSISVNLAPRNPRPGARNDKASSRFVLPAPFGPVSTTGSVPRASLASR